MIRKLFFFREHIVCTVFVVLSMALAHAQEATSPKVQKTSNNQVFAILANGMASESARQFQALLEVELGQAAGAELVERQQLGKVFEERRIAKIFSDEDGWRQTFAQSGLTGVSLFILVESTTSAELAENETTIRVRLVEPRWAIFACLFLTKKVWSAAFLRASQKSWRQAIQPCTWGIRRSSRCCRLSTSIHPNSGMDSARQCRPGSSVRCVPDRTSLFLNASMVGRWRKNAN